MKSSKTIFHIEKTRTGFSAYSNEIPVFTTGKSITKLLSNLEEAIELYFEDQPRKKILYHILAFIQHYSLNTSEA